MSLVEHGPHNSHQRALEPKILLQLLYCTARMDVKCKCGSNRELTPFGRRAIVEGEFSPSISEQKDATVSDHEDSRAQHAYRKLVERLTGPMKGKLLAEMSDASDL